MKRAQSSQEYQQFDFLSEMYGMSGSASSIFGEYTFFVTHEAAKELIKEIEENQAQGRNQLATKQIFNLSPKLPQ